MKVGRLILALLLAGAAVAAYWYFPNPLEEHEASTAEADPPSAT